MDRQALAGFGPWLNQIGLPSDLSYWTEQDKKTPRVPLYRQEETNRNARISKCAMSDARRSGQGNEDPIQKHIRKPKDPWTCHHQIQSGAAGALEADDARAARKDTPESLAGHGTHSPSGHVGASSRESWGKRSRHQVQEYLHGA